MSNEIKKNNTCVLVVYERGRVKNIYNDCVISKVGSKYFYVSSLELSYIKDVQFYLDDKQQVTDYSQDKYFYHNIKQYEDEIKRNKILSKLRKFFDNDYNSNHLTLEELEKISNMVGI